MLDQNKRVLSVFEWFSGIDQFFRFRADPVDGAELAARLEQDHPMLTMVLKRGYEVPEVVYPFGEPGIRFDVGDPIPWSLSIALPRICDTPDALFDEMIREVRGYSRQPLAAHYRAVLDWLASRHDRDWWIERSGGSIDFLADLHALFPDARFVHIHRDGRETALSMREYPVLRVAVSVMYGLVGEIEYSHEGLTEMERNDGPAIERLLETRPPVELYGRYWAEQVINGHAALQKLDPDVVLDVRFENLVADPRQELGRIADFFEIGRADDWIERGAALVREMPPLRFGTLSVDEQRRLDEACAPAMKLLQR